MCGIVGTRSPLELKSLAELIASRGTRAWSLSLVSLDTYSWIGVRQKRSPYCIEDLNETVSDLLQENTAVNSYWILHFQSPTAKKFLFHPAASDPEYSRALWHNGMIESAELEKFKDAEGNKPWDTGLLFNLVSTGSFEDSKGPITCPPCFESLTKFNGSFACLYLVVGEGLYCFRNKISPMYTSNKGTVCSVPFENSTKVVPEVIYEIPKQQDIPLRSVSFFINKYNPFGVQ